MYAVLRTGGKQYRIEPGMFLEIEKLEGATGEKIEFSEVLLVGNEDEVKIGKPLIPGAKISATIVEQTKADKVIIFKKIRRHGKQLKKGHRQKLTRVQINEITC
ncbi:MAG: 50S ribosomal protein L21 [Proteobacteria bacterium]|nr:50S ribosomal protein L21 [Pseudomonadota bacterium]